MAGRSQQHRIGFIVPSSVATYPRIFSHQAVSLARAGFDVTVLGQHPADERRDEVQILALRRPSSRPRRFLRSLAVFLRARRLGCDAYQINAPELLPAAIALKATTRARVVYDVWEHWPENLLQKYWLPRPVRRIASWLFDPIERFCARRVDHVLAATEHIASRFDPLSTTVIHNYPPVTEIEPKKSYDESPPILACSGPIMWRRGLRALLEIHRRLHPRYGLRLRFIGYFDQPDIEQAVRSASAERPGIEFIPSQPQQEAFRLLREATVGAVLYHPGPNHDLSQPNKLFEYMALGLPFVATNFPLWRELIGEAGVFTDPHDMDAVTEAVEGLLRDRERRERLGKMGRQMVLDRYSWEGEAERLVAIYRRTLGEGSQ